MPPFMETPKRSVVQTCFRLSLTRLSHPSVATCESSTIFCGLESTSKKLNREELTNMPTLSNVHIHSTSISAFWLISKWCYLRFGTRPTACFAGDTGSRFFWNRGLSRGVWKSHATGLLPTLQKLVKFRAKITDFPRLWLSFTYIGATLWWLQIVGNSDNEM